MGNDRKAVTTEASLIIVAEMGGNPVPLSF